MLQIAKLKTGSQSWAPPRCIIETLPNEWNHRTGLLPVLHILVAKEADQELLFPFDALTEELPQHQHICNQADLIPDQELRPNSPVEEAKVARMSEDLIEPMRDELMSLLMLSCHNMIETWSSLRHSEAPHALSNDNENHSDGDRYRIDERLAIAWKESTDNKLDSCASMSEVVCSSVVEQQETLRS